MIEKKNWRAAVPNTSVVSLYKALVSFLIEEAQLRGWHDVSECVRSVNAALPGRADQD